MLRAKTGIRYWQCLARVNNLKNKVVSALIEDPETKLTFEEQKLINQVPPTLYIGDYVEVFLGSQYSGIIVEQYKIGGRQQRLTVVLRNGKTINCLTNDIAFYISDFVSSDEVTQHLRVPVKMDRHAEKMDYIPTEYIRAIHTYQQTVRFKKGTAIRQLNQLYNYSLGNAGFKKQQEENIEMNTVVTLDQLASFAFDTKQPSSLDRHVTFLYLVANNTHYKPDNQLLNTDQWIVRPLEEVEVIEKVIDWIRTKDINYTGFLKRATNMINIYQSNVNENNGTLPQHKIDELQRDFTFTKNDRILINFIIDWIKIPKVILQSPHEVFGPTILKGLHCYNDLFVDRTLAATFLKQIGAFRPWDNIGLAEEAKIIHPFTWSTKAEQDEKKMNNFTKMFLDDKRQQLESNGFYATDPCDSLRHDFGDLPVYTIDDPSAKEIDDGISVEHIPGTNNKKDKTWLHIHIADPTAYIPPYHELGKIMSDRIQTLYLPERHFPMLPETLSSTAFSLGSSAKMVGNGSQYAFTFSALLDEQGELVVCKVRPSLVRNVIKLHYNDVDEMLKNDITPTIKTGTSIDLNISYTHPKINNNNSNNEIIKSTSSHLITSAVKEDLIDIYKLTQLHSKQRIKNGALNFIRPSPVISLQPEPLDLPQFSFDNVLRYASELPTINLSLDKSMTSIARSMVAEMMILGGRTVSRYAQENNIPLPFRTQQWSNGDSGNNSKAQQRILAERDPETGILSFDQLLKHVTSLPAAGLTTEPGQPHASMGILDGYCKATSPLRRYMDMIIHWQLKAHLLKQQHLPFDKQLLNRLGPYIESREKQMMRLQQRALQYWVLTLMQRLEHDDNMIWRCMVHEKNRLATTKLSKTMAAASGTILELGIRGRLDNLKQDVDIGDILNVRVSNINLFTGNVNLEPI
ncbi:unnamed protein product [Cunninghamella echinulata]